MNIIQLKYVPDLEGFEIDNKMISYLPAYAILLRKVL